MSTTILAGGLAVVLLGSNPALANSDLAESDTTANLDSTPARSSVDPPPLPLNELLGLSGSGRSAYFTKDKSFSGNTGYGIASIWATASPKELWGIKTYFDARIQDQNLSRNSRASFDLREGYAQSTFGDIDVRAGRQITVWGRADKINPTDSWTTRDFRLLAPNDEDQRIGVTSLQGTWNVGAYHLIGLWQPEWRYPGLPTPTLPGVSFQNVPPANPARQFGLKLDHSGQGTDWSVSYARAIDRTPDLSVLSTGPRGVQLGFLYQKLDVLGADGAVPIGNFGLRGELAYTRTKDHDGNDPLTKNSNLFVVLGCERTFDGVLNVNVQYLYRRTFDFQERKAISNPNTSLLAQQVDILSNQLAQDMHGASLRINYKAFNETLEIELAGVTWFNKSDSAIRPKVTYAISDRLKGILGGEIYHGPADTFFGRLNKTTTAYAELQIGF